MTSPPTDKPKRIRTKPPPPPPRPQQSMDPLKDIEWVYQHCGLKGKELRLAKQLAPASALGLLEWVLADKAHMRTFMGTMVPKMLMTQTQLDESAKRRQSSRVVLDLIDKAMRQAEADSGGVGESVSPEAPEGRGT